MAILIHGNDFTAGHFKENSPGLDACRRNGVVKSVSGFKFPNGCTILIVTSQR